MLAAHEAVVVAPDAVVVAVAAAVELLAVAVELLAVLLLAVAPLADNNNIPEFRSRRVKSPAAFCVCYLLAIAEARSLIQRRICTKRL